MTRRERLASVAPRRDAHCGLWLDRFATEHSSAAAATHFGDTIAMLRVPAGYPAYFARWREALTQLPELRATPATVRGRMVVGLGAESVHETSIALHRTYGVPYIPGSALKGLAASVARKRLLGSSWKAGGEAYRILFGEVEEAGFVTFHDALWMPPAEAPAPLLLPLAADVMTVHHPKYYGGKPSPPTEWDDPTPIPFLTANGSYWIALTGPPSWTEAALDLLALGLDEMGIGAKTAAGYGRMTVDTRPEKLRFEERPKEAPRETSGPPQDSTPGRAPRESSAARRREPWPVLVERVDLKSAPKAVPEILGGLEGEEKRRAANAILGRFGREKKLIRELRRLNEPWFALVVAAAQAETTESGEPENHQESDRAKPS